VQIDKYDDRLVLRNPGTLRLPIEKIYEGRTSKARNPRIQNMQRMIGYGENLGSGFPMILNAWRLSGWGEPKLENRIDIDEVALILPVQKPTETSKDETHRIKGDLSDVLQNVQKEHLDKLTERQITILEIILTDPTISAKVMSERTPANVRTIERDIAKLKRLCVIVREGGRKEGH